MAQPRGPYFSLPDLLLFPPFTIDSLQLPSILLLFCTFKTLYWINLTLFFILILVSNSFLFFFNFFFFTPFDFEYLFCFVLDCIINWLSFGFIIGAWLSWNSCAKVFHRVKMLKYFIFYILYFIYLYLFYILFYIFLWFIICRLIENFRFF